MSFQRLMSLVLCGINNCVAYLNEYHGLYLHLDWNFWKPPEDFSAVQRSIVTLNLAKCEFGKATVAYLRKVVGRNMVCQVDAQVGANRHFPVPSTKCELWCFWVIAGYYRGSSRSFAIMFFSWTDLLHFTCRLTQSLECQYAFGNMKVDFPLCLSLFAI